MSAKGAVTCVHTLQLMPLPPCVGFVDRCSFLDSGQLSINLYNGQEVYIMLVQ